MAGKGRQIQISVLGRDGTWQKGRVIDLPEGTGQGRWTLREVVRAVLASERDRRSEKSVEDIPMSEAQLLEALDLGGVRVAATGQLRHLPAEDEMLEHVRLALEDGLLHVMLNDQPWKGWETAIELPDPAIVWFARSVALRHHAWS